jgi:putative peptidoglycan lipid II flippase
MLKRMYNSQTKTVTFAAALLAFSALLSRLLGLFRDRLLAGRFGAGEELDIYFAAFRIPDFVYGILIIGGISAVFLPVLLP